MLDARVAGVLVGVVDVDEPRSPLVRDARDRPHQRRVLDEPVEPEHLPFADVRADLDGEAGVLLETLVRSHGGPSLQTALLASPAMSTVTETPTRIRPTDGTGSDLDAPWQVIVLNDDHNTFDGVAFALASVLPGIGFDQGMAFANRIHNAGRAIVWSGHREQAEHYWSQLKDHGLTMAPLDQ